MHRLLFLYTRARPAFRHYGSLLHNSSPDPLFTVPRTFIWVYVALAGHARSAIRRFKEDHQPAGSLFPAAPVCGIRRPSGYHNGMKKLLI
jgi:hypothetical protein